MRKVFYGWWIVAVVFLTQCVSGGLGFSSMGVFQSVLAEALGWTRAQVSWGISLIALGAVVYAPVVGRVVDRFGARWVQLAGALIMATAFVLLRGMETKLQFYLLMAVLSLGVCAIHVPGAITVMASIVGQCFGRMHYGAIYGRMTSFMVIGNAMGAPLFGMIRDATGSYAPALGIVMLTDVVAILCITGLTLPPGAQGKSGEKRGSEGADK